MKSPQHQSRSLSSEYQSGEKWCLRWIIAGYGTEPSVKIGMKCLYKHISNARYWLSQPSRHYPIRNEKMTE